jgi:hypothetical protein
MTPQHESNSVKRDRREPIGRVLNPWGTAALVWPILHNPSFPSVNEIIASTLQQVLVPELLALDVPISRGNVLQFSSTSAACLKLENGRYQNKWSIKALKPDLMRGTSLVVWSSFLNLTQQPSVITLGER